MTTARTRTSDTDAGLDMDDLRSIALETGIDVHALESAVARLDAKEMTPEVRRFLGIPVGTAYVSVVNGDLSDDAWHTLVADLRRTFHANGKLTSIGGIREWSNGNLRISAEPDRTGTRTHLIMQTSGGVGMNFLRFGGLLIAMGVIMFLASMTVAPDPEAPLTGMMLALLGSGMMGFGGLTNRVWTRTRYDQMKSVGERAVTRIGTIADADASQEAVGENVDIHVDLEQDDEQSSASTSRRRDRL